MDVGQLLERMLAELATVREQQDSLVQNVAELMRQSGEHNER